MLVSRESLPETISRDTEVFLLNGTDHYRDIMVGQVYSGEEKQRAVSGKLCWMLNGLCGDGGARQNGRTSGGIEYH